MDRVCRWLFSQSDNGIYTSLVNETFTGLSKGKSIKDCLELANKVAGVSTTKFGAGDAMPFLKDIN